MKVGDKVEILAGPGVGSKGTVEEVTRWDYGVRVRFDDPTGNLGILGYMNYELKLIEESKNSPNPKDLVGSTKVSLSKLPAAGIIHAAHAMMNGAVKYSAFNWRANKVQASIYVDAVQRHIACWFDQKEETASDSGVHHLGHAMASLAILLDAQETGNLIDDRPTPGKAADILERLAKTIKERQNGIS